MTSPLKLQQVLVLIGLALCSMSDGYIFGQMSGMINALREKDSPIFLSEDDVSWIASIINVTCIIGFAIVILITEVYGRKITLTIVSTPVLICWLMLYFATEKYTILASRIIVGIAFGGVLPLIYMNIGEYVAPDQRALAVNLVACGMGYLGTMLGHILSIFLHWRYVALLGMIPTSLSILIPLFWVESPFWLANSGRYEECEKAFQALHGSNKISNEEVKQLVNKSSQSSVQHDKKINALLQLAKTLIVFCKTRYFYRLVMLIFFIAVYRVVAGKILLSTLANSMIQDITGSKNIFLFTLLVDSFALGGIAIFCFFLSHLNTRPLLFISGIIANFIQITFSITLYFCYKTDQKILIWINIVLLALYFIIVSAGPYSILETLLTEIFPLKTKAATIFISAAIGGVFQFFDIKVASEWFPVVGYHGIFFVHTAVSFFCLIYLYFYLPETKGKSLREIELFLKYNKFQSENRLNEIDQNRDLINQNIAA